MPDAGCEDAGCKDAGLGMPDTGCEDAGCKEAGCEEADGADAGCRPDSYREGCPITGPAALGSIEKRNASGIPQSGIRHPIHHCIIFRPNS